MNMKPNSRRTALQSSLVMKRCSKASGRSLCRAGLSIMEVLFAIAVLTIGMLGVASILPVATNNSSMALQNDRAVEEINNRVATDLARLKGSFNSVIVANNSQRALASQAISFNIGRPQQRTFEVSTADFRSHLNFYDGGSTAVRAVALPDAFCIDPWFLSAANTLRDDSTPGDNRNGYDRTLFPCYDPNYAPLATSPSDRLINSNPTSWEGPRFTRVALPFDGGSGALSTMSSEALTRYGDDLSLFHPEDSTLGPGLFVQRSRSATNARALSKSTLSSEYSSMVLMSRSDTGSDLFNAAVVTMKDRHVVTIDGGEFGPGGGLQAHNLEPYTAANPVNPSGGIVPEDTLLFDGEQLGYVSYAQSPIIGGGGGEFIFQTNQFVEPDVGVGDWVMLMRREYERQQAGPSPQIIPTNLHFAWYQVSDISAGPALNGNVWETQISVRGPDWVFHPIQVTLEPFTTVFAPPYYGNINQPTWGNPPLFDFSAMPANGTNPNQTNPLYKHQDYGTFIVLMPDVVSVKQFQVQL